MNTRNIRELNDTELEIAAGEMDCDTAKIVSNIYRVLSDTFYAYRDMGRGSYWQGRSEGVLAGGCGPQPH